MPAVSNSSPLIYLSALGDLDLLPALFRSILIPEAVFQEVVVLGQNQRGQREVESAIGDWLEVRPVKNREGIRMLTGRVHLGEAEAIVLANDSGLPVLLDHRRASHAARLIQIQVIRTIGVYLEAKRCALIHAVRPKLDHLRKEGFRLQEPDYRAVLDAAGEA